MRAGRLRDRVIFQRETETADNAGGYASSWADYLTVWASFMPERGQERIETDRVNASFSGKLHIRSSSESRAVTESDRVSINGELYNIRSISNPDQRNRMLEMVVERGVGT